MQKVEAEIISIGDELLIGQVVNTNAAWMGQELSACGIAVKQVTVISDNRDHILAALREASGRAAIVLVTGGLGPTKDDITKQTLCSYFGTDLIFHEETYQMIVKIFGSRGYVISELNRKQAEIPANCTPIPNPNGTAPGMWFEKDGIIYVSMPGVPFEMKPMMTEYILPELKKRFVSQVIIHKTILTQGVGESSLAEQIESWEDSLPLHIKLAYLPQPGIVRLRLTATGTDAPELESTLDDLIDRLKQIIGDLIFGYDNDTLEGVVGKILLSNNLSLSTAESCTGGYLAHMITSVPGSSAWFKGSIISYANEVKQVFLDVDEEDLITWGAVSEPVVRKMAETVRKKLGTDYSIATSGIAGPDGGTEEKPVGTTWIAVAGPSGTLTRKFLFGDGRDRNIHRTAIFALNLLRKMLLKDLS